MSPIKGTDYQKAVEAMVKRRPAPGRHSALNSLRHISKAWDLREADMEMAIFRSCCAEEEAATSIFHSLRRLGYAGAKRLNHHRHVHKLAVIPFLWVVNKAFMPVHEAGFEINAQIEGSEGNETICTAFRLPNSTHEWRPTPPLHFSLSNDRGKYDFRREMEALRQVSNVKTFLDHVREGVSNRNRILYATGDGHPIVEGNATAFIESQFLNVTKLLTTYLLIDSYPQKQSFVQQCLDVFVSFLGMLPDEVEITEEEGQRGSA